ncbi:MAG: glycoside hydrolase family 3 protein [Acidobacteria bacterium]|nr:glycoside hydrolase family 3 protein [Acidobacteriota bacterium]
MATRPISIRVFIALIAAVLAAAALISAAGHEAPLDRAAARWVQQTLKAMTLDQKVGQLFMPTFESSYLANDTETFDRLVALARDHHVGGFLTFGASEPAPSVMLNPTYGTVTLGQPFNAASLFNRLQQAAAIPLLNAADFETGVGFRIAGATSFPRAMAFGAAGDERLAFEAGRIAGIEARAIGVHVNFAPVVDVNNNARNPVINTRSFGEDPAKVGAMASAYVRGLRAGGALATLKHFPGHGDTDVDSHLGLPVITHPRARLDEVELPPFRAAIEAGAEAVMSGHIEMPALDPTPGTPATLSRPMVTDLLRGELGFDGLIYTDSMGMHAVSKMLPPGEAAVKAVQAGNDVVLHSPDDIGAIAAVRAAIERGEIDRAQVDRSVERILTAKARLALHRSRLVSLDDLPARVGGRAHAAVADEVSQRSITLIKDEKQQVPLAVPAGAQVLYLSVLDYPTGWRIAAPSRTFQPELRRRWPNLTSIELSDRTAPGELELVRALAPRMDAIVASVFVRTASFSGRMDLAPPVVRLLNELAAQSATRGQPFVTVMFGNPYVATFLQELPAVLLTYDFYDRAERSAVAAIAGDAPIGGRLPIALPGLFPAGHGLDRPGRAGTAAP